MDRVEATDFAPGVGGAMAADTLSLDAWLEAGQSAGATVVLRTDDARIEEHYEALARQPRLIVEFAMFTDGRGFSHGRKLRQNGFAGELLASGEVLSDQLEFLRSCGFDDILGDAAGGDPEFPGFSVRYQA